MAYEGIEETHMKKCTSPTTGLVDVQKDFYYVDEDLDTSFIVNFTDVYE